MIKEKNWTLFISIKFFCCLLVFIAFVIWQNLIRWFKQGVLVQVLATSQTNKYYKVSGRRKISVVKKKNALLREKLFWTTHRWFKKCSPIK